MHFKSNAQFASCMCYLCFSLLMVNSVYAATWTIEPSISATETYTDNVTLSAENESSEFISQINPGFSVLAKGRRIQLSGQYSLGYINYWDSAYSDRYFNQGRLSASMELVKRHVNVDTAATVSEQVIDPTKITAFDEHAITNNRTETRTVMLNPTLKNRFGRYVDSSLSYKHSRVAYSTKKIDPSFENSLHYSLSSGRWFKKFAWKGNALIQSGQQKNANQTQVSGRLDYSVLRKWKLFLTGHVQKRNYITVGSDNGRYFVKNEVGVVWTPSRKVYLEGGGGVVLNSHVLSQDKLEIEQRIWRAKIVINPTARTLFEFGREQAIFGRRIYSSFKHYTKKTIWSSTYAETIITPQQSRYATDFETEEKNENRDEVDGIAELNRLVTNDVILRKRLDVSGKINRKRLEVTGSIFYEKGEYQTTRQTDERYGLKAIFELNFSKRLSGFASSALQRYQFSEQVKADNILMIKTGIAKDIGKNLSARLIYILQKRSVNSSSVEYTSNKLVAMFSLSL